MTKRVLTVGGAQMGPVMRADSKVATVARMVELMRKAGELGLGGEDDEKTRNGIAAIERGISAFDVNSLLRARPWLEGELAKLEVN